MTVARSPGPRDSLKRIRKRSSILLVLACLLVVTFMAGGRPRDDVKVDAVAIPDRPAADSFPIGWYDSIDWLLKLPEVASHGMTRVMPYHSDKTDVGHYLDAAREAGVDVLVEIDRSLLHPPDPEGVARFVRTHKDHPSLAGWYLADEPSLTAELGPMTIETATAMYDTIKAVDPDHQVSIAFSPVEQVWLFSDAMDVMMFDDYPAVLGAEEFAGFETWRERLLWASQMAAGEDGFVPIVQAFRSEVYRLPTAAEERYMTYASVQAGATGLFFWTRFLSTQQWIDGVLTPIVSELRALEPALAAGPIGGLVTSSRDDVQVTMFRNPRTLRYTALVVHHGPGTVGSQLSFDEDLDVRALRSPGSGPVLRANEGRVTARLGAYEARIYTLERGI